jgi:hypothetical protein
LYTIPSHSSHKLQPLDAGYFSPLKRSYGAEIKKLIRAYVTHISKEDFFPAFYTAFCTIITASSAGARFQATGLVPYDPNYVITQLNVRLRMPALSPTLPIIWKPKTLSNNLKLQSQLIYLKDRIVRHQNSSLTTILRGLNQAIKGTITIAHKLTLLREEIIRLRKANNLLSRRRRTKKRRIQERGVVNLESKISKTQRLKKRLIYNYKLICERIEVVRSKASRQNDAVDVTDNPVITYRTCPNVIDTSNSLV